MGAKIITEKDFWMCSCGAVPAQMQGSRASNKKISGEAYITIADTATSSWMDFKCTKSMLLGALIGAVVAIVAAVVIVALVVGTGGLGAIAILGIGGMMLAGAAGGVVGGLVMAVKGALKCGQKNATARQWVGGKADLILTGSKAVTSNMTMTCKVGGVITFAPGVKSQLDAVLVGGLNYLTKFAECALAGAAVGAGGYLIPSLATGSLAMALPTGGSILSNVAGSFGGVWGGSRALFGLNNLTQQNAAGNISSGSDAIGAVVDGGIPEIGMSQRLLSGHPQPTDYLLFLYFLNIKTGKGKPTVEEPNNTGDKDGNATPEDDGVQNTKGQGGDKDGQSGGKNGEAYEEGKFSNKMKGDLGEAKVIDDLKAQGYTDVVQVQNNSGHGVDVIARNPKTGAVKCVEVKTNSSRLSVDQAKGGKSYVENRLDRAIDGMGHYKVPPNPEQLPKDALKAKEWIEDAQQIDYEVHQVPVDNASGTIGTPKVSTW